MGLDISHDIWGGPYSRFNTFRTLVCEAAGMPPLDIMEGFYSNDGFCNNPFYEVTSYKGLIIKNQLPIRWESLKPSALHEFLFHSDCDGEIEWEKCKGIADELEKLKLISNEPEYWNKKLKYAIEGFRYAYEQQETVEFS